MSSADSIGAVGKALAGIQVTGSTERDPDGPKGARLDSRNPERTGAKEPLSSAADGAITGQLNDSSKETVGFIQLAAEPSR